MAIPKVQIVSKQIISRTTQSSGLTGAILGQFERGPETPVLVSSVGEFLEKFTSNGVIPSQATNRSAYYSAINFLKDSDRLWVRRVVPATAKHAGAYFLQDAAPPIIDLEDNTVSVASNQIQNTDTAVEFPGVTGDCVTVFGADLPAGLVNGQKYFIRKGVLGGGGPTISFFDSYEHANDDGLALTGIVTLSDVGTGTMYVMATEYGDHEGLSDPEDVAIVGSNAALLYAADPGSWGDEIRFTVEVPKLDETGLHCSDEIVAETGELPTAETWLSSDYNPGLPVHLIPVGSAVLPAKSTNGNRLGSLTPYYAFSTQTDKFKLAESLANAIAATGLTFDGSGDVGRGEVAVFPAGTIAEVESSGVNYVTNELDTVMYGADDAITIPALTPCMVVGENLPAPLVQGQLYYTFAGSEAGKVRLATSVQNASAHIAVSLSSSNTVTTFHVVCALITESGLDRPTVVRTGDGEDYIIVGQHYETGTPFQFTGTGLPTVSSPLTTGTTYYAVDDSDLSSGEYRIKVALSAANAAAGTTVTFTDVQASGTFSIVPANMVGTGWSNQIEIVDLDGAVNYTTNTIKLAEHSGSYQNWVPGEAVRVYASGENSVLPYGLSSSGTYYVLPVGAGRVKLCTLSGNTLDGVSSLSVVNLNPDSSLRGTGLISLIPAIESIPAGCFRIKVWRDTLQNTRFGLTGGLTLEESFICSVYTDKTDQSGRSLFLEQRLNSSKYIRGVSMTAVTGVDVVAVKPVPFLTALSGGKNDSIDNTGTVSSSEFVTALEDLTDSVQYPISYLLDGGLTFPDYQIALISLATQREDCIAVLSTPQRLEYDSNPGRSIVEYVQQNLPSTSFGAIFTPWQLATDATAGNRDIMVPPDGYVAGQMSRVDSTKGPWEAAAGVENGAIRSRGGALKFNQADLDNLYANRVNPIIQIQGGGPTIWGNVTLLSAQAPLSRINVRKLVNKIHTDLKTPLLSFVQSPITPRTYEQIFSLVDAYLLSIQLRGGIKDRKVVCDASNNSSEDADNQIINVWVYIKPTMLAEYINVTTVVTPNSVSFDTIDVVAS